MIEKFNIHWNKAPSRVKERIRVCPRFEFDHGFTVDIALFEGNECLAIGNYFNKLVIPSEDRLRHYFHSKYGFIGCGVLSRIWFYFDEQSIIVNDHSYNYPFDELMKNTNCFVDRLRLDSD